MPALLMRHKVEHVQTWRSHFEEQEITRRANGSLGVRIFQNEKDPKEVLVLLEWDDLERAHLFVRSDDLQEALAKSGVTDQPDIWFLDDIGKLAV